MEFKTSYAIEQRLRMIDFLLFVYGHVNRSALIDYFGIAEAAASRDFKRYKEIAPSNLIYDAVERTYLRSTVFKRVYE